MVSRTGTKKDGNMSKGTKFWRAMVTDALKELGTVKKKNAFFLLFSF